MTKWNNQSRTSSKRTQKTRKGWATTVINLLGKLGNLLRDMVRVIQKAIHELFLLILRTANAALETFLSPVTICNAMLLALLGIALVTAAQWFGMGLWIGRFFGIRLVYGIGIGTAAVIFGGYLNWIQLSSRLYKLQEGVAAFYRSQKVDINYEGDTNDPNQRESNKYSVNHKEIKKYRGLSYYLEMMIMVAYTLAGNFSIFGLLAGIFALFVPENALDFVSNYISIMGAASDHMANQETGDGYEKSEYVK